MALSMPNIYQSTAVLAPKSGAGTGAISPGVPVWRPSESSWYNRRAGSDGMSKPAIALEKMKSLSFFKQHLYEDLLVDLLAFESWDSSTRQLIDNTETMIWLRANGFGK